MTETETQRERERVDLIHLHWAIILKFPSRMKMFAGESYTCADNTRSQPVREIITAAQFRCQITENIPGKRNKRYATVTKCCVWKDGSKLFS